MQEQKPQSPKRAKTSFFVGSFICWMQIACHVEQKHTVTKASSNNLFVSSFICHLLDAGAKTTVTKAS
jgi:hypothetical protein